MKIVAFLCAGLIIGFIIPYLAKKMIHYKCAIWSKNISAFKMLNRHKQMLIFLNASLFVLAGWQMPLAEAILVCAFILIALTATVVDTHIRIIANETVILMLILGIIYRIIVGGAYSLLGSLGALMFVVVIFGATAVITKLITKKTGIGAGDIKLAIAIAITVGYPGVIYFLGGMAFTIGVYCAAGLLLRMLTPKSTFPMCGHIMTGFLIVLFLPYIPL